VTLFVLQAWPHPPQLAGSLVVFTQLALAPALHRVGVAAFAQACPHAGGVPPQLEVPRTGAGQTEQLVPQELVEIDVSGTHVPVQLW
jgi:hypothetical protein